MCLNLNNFFFFTSPLEQFEINSYNNFLNYYTTLPIENIEYTYFQIIDFFFTHSLWTIFSILIIVFWIQTNIKNKSFIYLFIILQIFLNNINLIAFSDILISNTSLFYTPSLKTEFNSNLNYFLDFSLDIAINNITSILMADDFIDARLDEYFFTISVLQEYQCRFITDFLTEWMFDLLDISIETTPTSIDLNLNEFELGIYYYLIEFGMPFTSEITDDIENKIIETLWNSEIELIFWNMFNQEIPFSSIFWSIEDQTINLEFVTILSSFLNIYSVLFCFFFTYILIYLIYNKMLSNNSNTLIPNLYQILAENLYKISLNLFYSILGKHVSIPEFFIKINTIFIFLILSNVQGMIPYISTLTSALTNTFFIALALFISILTTLFDKKGVKYFLNLFMPSGCPILLSLLIIPIELISYSFRLVSLSVRLFANMMAGHTLLKVIVGFSWVIVFLGNSFLINIFPILILFILTLLEFGVALIQAYIFTVLSCIYLRDIFEGH